MTHVGSFIQKFRVVMTALIMTASLMFAGCMLDRSALGCVPDEVGDDTGRCRLVSADAGTDAFIAMMDAEVDSGTDAGPDDAGEPPDAGPDDGGTDSGPPPMDGGTDAGRDSGPPDAGTDACVPRTEVCGNGVDEDCSGADLPCPQLHIDFNAATMPTGIAFQVVWNEPPPIGRRESGWYYHNCLLSMPLASRVEARCDAPELLPGRMLQFFPYDDSAGAATCTIPLCPSLCDRTSCPGFAASYGAAYESRPVLAGELVFNTDPGTASDGPAPGDTAWIHFTIP
jgi:hypothetical protein